MMNTEYNMEIVSELTQDLRGAINGEAKAYTIELACAFVDANNSSSSSELELFRAYAEQHLDLNPTQLSAFLALNEALVGLEADKTAKQRWARLNQLDISHYPGLANLINGWIGNDAVLDLVSIVRLYLVETYVTNKDVPVMEKVNELRNDLILPFILGGKAQFTVSSSKSHISYEVKAPRKKTDKGGYTTDYNARTRFVRANVHADGHAFAYLGELKEVSQGRWELHHNPNKSTLGTDSVAFKVLERVLWQVQWSETTLKEEKGWTVQHKDCCARCARTLTDPQSIERGFGPDCWKILGFLDSGRLK